MPSSPLLLLLLLDFDLTLTKKDTLAPLASLAPHAPSPSFATLSTAYLTSLASLPPLLPPISNPSTRLTTLLALLNSPARRQLESTSIQRVESAGVFRGVTRRDVAQAGRKYGAEKGAMRAGWERCVAGVLKGGKGRGRVGVVSVGWSREWIAGVMRGARREERLSEAEVGQVEIVANEIVGLDEEGGSGEGRVERRWGEEEEEGGGIWTAGDKGRVGREVFGVGVGGRGDGDRLSVYVGDSVTDLEVLLAVDVGVCMRGEEGEEVGRELMGVLEWVGVECRWIGEWGLNGGVGRVEGEGEGERKKGLWWARDFEEVWRCGLFGCEKGESEEDGEERG